MLLHRRSEGISSIQLFESSKYWGLQVTQRGQDRYSALERKSWVPRIRPQRKATGMRRAREGLSDSLSLEITGDSVQPHDQVFFVRLQTKAARGPDQEVAGLTYGGLSILG